MKFGKRLYSQIEDTLPEWRDKYLSYKQLKKRLKLLSSPEPRTIIAHERVEGLIRGGDVGNISVRFPANCSSPSSLVSTDSKNPSVNHEGGAVSVVENGNLSSANSTDIINPCQPLFPYAGLDRSLTAEEVDFIHLLNAELDKFNYFFMQKEEDYVIRLQELKERIEAVTDRVSPASASSFHQEDAFNEEMINIRKAFVNFHGEMVLLENYSSLNYTGLVKILKKHDKRTGAFLRMPFIQNVLHQPFFTTELLSKLVCECERSLQWLFPPPSLCIDEGTPTMASKIDQGRADQLPEEEQKNDSQDELESSDERRSGAINAQEQGYFHGEDVESVRKSIIAALRTIKDLRRGSSTYSIFSLPPFSAKEDNEVGDTIVRSLQCLPLFCHQYK